MGQRQPQALLVQCGATAVSIDLTNNVLTVPPLLFTAGSRRFGGSVPPPKCVALLFRTDQDLPDSILQI